MCLRNWQEKAPHQEEQQKALWNLPQMARTEARDPVSGSPDGRNIPHSVVLVTAVPAVHCLQRGA